MSATYGLNIKRWIVIEIPSFVERPQSGLDASSRQGSCKTCQIWFEAREKGLP